MYCHIVYHDTAIYPGVVLIYKVAKQIMQQNSCDTAPSDSRPVSLSSHTNHRRVLSGGVLPRTKLQSQWVFGLEATHRQSGRTQVLSADFIQAAAAAWEQKIKKVPKIRTTKKWGKTSKKLIKCIDFGGARHKRMSPSNSTSKTAPYNLIFMSVLSKMP